jgi:hypothetical protein
VGGGHGGFGAFLNAGVHTLMYLYYFLAGKRRTFATSSVSNDQSSQLLRMRKHINISSLLFGEI